MEKLEIITDEAGNKIVIIPDIIFVNKQNIEWEEVENYLVRYIGEIIEIAESSDIIYIGKDFPDEYAGSKYTRKTKGARAKAKANAVQGVRELVEIASDKTFRENHKEKHNSDAGNGWYYCTSSGKMYLYDLVDIKKEASNPLKTNK
ncbi:MAG: hypothetical protein K2I03_04140 [Lachnospiraceae bacterium]|nr:hypothetical protein [Lachnospiraceae bacterium]